MGRVLLSWIHRMWTRTRRRHWRWETRCWCAWQCRGRCASLCTVGCTGRILGISAVRWSWPWRSPLCTLRYSNAFTCHFTQADLHAECADRGSQRKVEQVHLWVSCRANRPPLAVPSGVIAADLCKFAIVLVPCSVSYDGRAVWQEVLGLDLQPSPMLEKENHLQYAV